MRPPCGVGRCPPARTRCTGRMCGHVRPRRSKQRWRMPVHKVEHRRPPGREGGHRQAQASDARGDAATSKRAAWQLWARGSAGGPFAAEDAPNATATLRVRFRLEIAAAEGGKVKSTAPRFMCTHTKPPMDPRAHSRRSRTAIAPGRASVQHAAAGDPSGRAGRRQPPKSGRLALHRGVLAERRRSVSQKSRPSGCFAGARDRAGADPRHVRRLCRVHRQSATRGCILSSRES